MSSEPTTVAGRRFFAPEVIQTSAMDCGPAALKCLLEGHGVSVSYGRLREACQTSVDGTSIDTLETLARTVGLDAEQVMMPADHLLLPESEALPAIVVVRLPNGFTHFVVVWSVHGPWVQVMDPARGRRWVRREAFLRELYIHTLSLPAEAFRDWAGSDGFLQPLRRRMAPLGLADGGAALVARAVADPGWRAVAALDAAVRTVGALAAAGGVAPGDEAARLVDTLVLEATDEAVDEAADGRAGALPARLTTASSAPRAEDGTEQVTMRGAVLVRVGGAVALDDARRAELPRELRAALDEPPSRPAATLLALLRQDGALRWGALALGLSLAACGAVLEALVFRGLLDAAAGAGAGPLERWASRLSGGALGKGAPLLVVGALAIVAALLVLEWPVARGLRGAGRRLEQRLRQAFLRKIPRLGDRYFQSRPVSDMAERAHLSHRLRALPSLGGQLMRAALELIVTGAALAWLYPRGAPLALTLAAAMLVVPLAAQPALAERDLRMRNHAGALARFYLDALLGLVAIRTHRAEASMGREHAARAREWFASARAALRAALAAESAQAIVGYGLAAALIGRFLGEGRGAAEDPGSVLLVVYWSLALPALGQEIAALVQQYPGQRNVSLRLAEPLGAPEDGPATQPQVAPLPAAPADAARIEISNVVVQAAGHVILTVEALAIAPGEHVAIVGPSGAGKSSLLGLLLGWHRASKESGEEGGVLHVDGASLEGAALEALRRRTVWVDPTVYLWNRTMHENLAYGLAAAPTSLDDAVAAADLAEIVERLPRGGDSPLGEAGALVSGGEGQRVRFGRGLTRDRPRLVILDEPFRGLVRDRRHALLERARARWADATLLCVTHDIDETRSFPRVLVVDQGRVVEDGSPAELAARAGSRYAALLDAETRVRRSVWAADGTVAWRRLAMQGGRVVGAPEDLP